MNQYSDETSFGWDSLYIQLKGVHIAEIGGEFGVRLNDTNKWFHAYLIRGNHGMDSRYYIITDRSPERMLKSYVSIVTAKSSSHEPNYWAFKEIEHSSWESWRFDKE